MREGFIGFCLGAIFTCLALSSGIEDECKTKFGPDVTCVVGAVLEEDKGE